MWDAPQLRMCPSFDGSTMTGTLGFHWEVWEFLTNLLLLKNGRNICSLGLQVPLEL